MKKHYAQHKYNTKIKLKNLRTKCPKDFWKILKTSSCQKTHSSNHVYINVFFEHFKSLNELTETDNGNEELISNRTNGESENVEINSPITENEILEAIRSLKNEKAFGEDAITLLGCFGKLFTWTHNLC